MFGRMFEGRIVVLGGEVDDTVAGAIVSQLVLLDRASPTEDIRLYITSPGGSLSAGFAIHDAMNQVSADVSTWAVGFVGSVAQFLLCAGAPGKRYALPTARIAMRQPRPTLPATDVAAHSDLYEGWQRELVELTARRTGRDPATVARDLRDGRTMSAMEAKEYGIVDHVVAATRSAPQNN
ncbi:ATP-dependent Clp protease proteolytic subunit [Actinocrispum wychmicini]|uniref:ATP-dependent Clp protease proteolytic subunit n=1 Tax=Actinocrispum wychmicini TaxID=1213861 RepID=UPI003C7EB6F3